MQRNGPGYAASFFISLLVRDRTFLMIIVRKSHPGSRSITGISVVTSAVLPGHIRAATSPATAIVDALAVTPSDSDSLALWNAHVDRTRAAARTFKAGWPSPRLAARDPYALRALVLIACIATFVAAGGERWKRIAAAFDWQGVVLPANFRVDAWGSLRRPIPASRRSFSPASIPAKPRAPRMPPASRSPFRPAAPWSRHRGAPLQDRRHRDSDPARRRRRPDLGVQRHSRQAADDRADQGP
jgi:Domain of unknown function (DUF4175)